MLSFAQVNVSIAGAQVLRNVSFALPAGATAALIGRNGAGKTTVARTVMGFTQATGSIKLAATELGPVAPHDRPAFGIGYAPEDRRLFSSFTVEENILLPARVAKWSQNEIPAPAGSGLQRAARTGRAAPSACGLGVGRPGQDGRAGPRADAGHQPRHSG